jgi:hypothetical protein
MIDAIDLALMHGATATVYRWTPDRPSLVDAA